MGGTVTGLVAPQTSQGADWEGGGKQPAWLLVPWVGALLPRKSMPTHCGATTRAGPGPLSTRRAGHLRKGLATRGPSRSETLLLKDSLYFQDLKQFSSSSFSQKTKILNVV